MDTNQHTMSIVQMGTLYEVSIHNEFRELSKCAVDLEGARGFYGLARSNKWMCVIPNPVFRALNNIED